MRCAQRCTKHISDLELSINKSSDRLTSIKKSCKKWTNCPLQEIVVRTSQNHSTSLTLEFKSWSRVLDLEIERQITPENQSSFFEVGQRESKPNKAAALAGLVYLFKRRQRWRSKTDVNLMHSVVHSFKGH